MRTQAFKRDGDCSHLQIIPGNGAYCALIQIVCKDCGKPTRSEIEKFNRQYKGLAVEHAELTKSH